MLERFLPILLPIGLVCWQAAFKFIEEADTRFIMNLGRYVLEHGFPHVDPFTIHEGLTLVVQQWLSGVFFWEVYKHFSLDGLLAIDCVFGSAAVLIYWRLCLLVSDGNKILSAVMAFVVGVLIASNIVPRPLTLSISLFVGEVFLLEKFTRTGNAKFLLPLLPLSTLLVNLQAAMWMMSLVLCLPFLFVRSARHAKFLLAAMAGIFLSALINPYGLDAMTYVLRSYGVDLISSNVSEMFTPSAHVWEGKIFYLTEALIIFALARCKPPWRYVLLSGGIIFLAVMHWRNQLPFYLLATVPLAYAWKDFSLGKISARTDGKFRALLTALLLLLLIVGTGAIALTLQDGFNELNLPIKILFSATTLFMLYNLLVVKVEGRILHPTLLPRKILSLFIGVLIVGEIFLLTFDENRRPPPDTCTRALEFLLRTERPENISLYVGQGFGGLAGSFGIRYYIDSRSEVFIDANNGRKNIFAEYVDFTSGKLNYKDFFSRYKFTHIILMSDTPFLFDELSADKNFRVVYESERVDGSKVVRCKVFVPKEFHQ